MKKHYVILLLVINNSLFSQDYSYKSKEYDLKIFNYLMEKTETDSISLKEYLEYSKPFSKWDIRPLKVDKVWAIDTVYSASTIPNFIWGSFSNKYNLTESQAMNKPNLFLEVGVNIKKESSEFLNQNLEKFQKLTKKINKSSNKVFLNQQSLQRVDNIYCENNIYWTYIIPDDSPFPISDHTKVLLKEKFTKQQKEILILLSELNVYSAFKSDNGGIDLLIDGFTDNSYGFYFGTNGSLDTYNKLFQIMIQTQLTKDFYYYVAN